MGLGLRGSEHRADGGLLVSTANRHVCEVSDMARRWFSSTTLAVLTAGALIAGMLGFGVASASSARPTTAGVVHPSTTGPKLPVTVPATLNGVAGTLHGTVPKFIAKSGNTYAHLVFTRFTANNGTVTNLANPITRNDPVTNAAATNTCQILNLTLGPLHLNLLGLVVDLNRVHLTITAVRGPGNLLGNLLCAVANLLNGSAPAAQQASLLNDLIGMLGILRQL